MRGLIFDPFSGISGDMILGALVDIGLSAEWLEDFVASLDLGRVGVVVERADRSGVSCARVRFELPREEAHRHLDDVREIVEGSGASDGVKRRAMEVFRHLAEAEAAIHGIDVDRVHFHEVGALDAILDVMCAVAGIEELGVERCYTRPVTVGTGWIDIDHGRFPVPAPATVKLLEGFDVRQAPFRGECTTPTGAALLTTLVDRPTPPETFVVEGSGYGAGSRDPEGHPNCLRIVGCDLSSEDTDRLVLVQADMDDLPAEYVPPAQDALFAAGARDVVAVPVTMKKGRPGIRIEALVDAVAVEAVLGALFRTTSTIGARYWPVTRPALPRSEEVIEWRGERIRRKRVRLPGGGERVKPEYDDVVRAGETLGIAPYEVRLALEEYDRLGE